MAGSDWLGSRRSEVATDRILDAAGELYRYFENREALHTAYVHREAYALHARMLEEIAGVEDPRERLITGFLTSLELVRRSPALSSWFTTTGSPIGIEIAEQSDVIQAMGSAFVVSLGTGDPDAAQRKARWLVRVLTSMLLLPGRDPGDERAMVEEFLVPVLAPARDTAG
jgi:AcrR family transcriptional regulator